MNDALGDRMKGYEAVSSHQLTRRVPVIVRVDGRAFHTFTGAMKKPFDPSLVDAMAKAAHSTALEIQGCKMSYTQSDEASFLLCDYDTIETQPWFGYDLSKVVSLAASTFTAYFNWYFANDRWSTWATFDARAFNVPESDVANYFLWRAKDWRRNSVQMLAQSQFSQKELHGKKIHELHMMLAERGVLWDELAPILRFGTFWLPGLQEERFDVEPGWPTMHGLVERAVKGRLIGESA